MLLLMTCSLAMSVATPVAFSQRAGLFVGSYVTMACGRAVYMAILFRGENMGQNFARLVAWSMLSGILWLAGVVSTSWRCALWIAAVAVDLAGPAADYWIPKLGRAEVRSWPLRGLHLMERCQQVFIIALGESILLIGDRLVKGVLSSPVLAASLIGFLTVVALWQIYFLQTSEAGECRFSRMEAFRDHTRLARNGLVYAHGALVCGTIVTAVAI